MTRWAERAKAAITQRSSTVKTDESLIPSLLAVSSVPNEYIAFSEKRVSSVLTVSVQADVKKADLNSAQIKESDRWCWPHSSAMNGREIDIFLIRLAYFRSLGVDLVTAEKLADRLVIRDRDLDDRIACFECHFLRTGWHCMNSQNAGVCLQYSNSKLPNDFVYQLQRCPGFKSEIGEVNGNR